MEDTHIAILNFNDNPDLDLFGIFDGHGGIYYFIQVVKQQFQFKKSFPNSQQKMGISLEEITLKP